MHFHVCLGAINGQSMSVLLLQCCSIATHMKCQEICKKRETSVMKKGLTILLPRTWESEKPENESAAQQL